jgi:hypothetical protein
MVRLAFPLAFCRHLLPSRTFASALLASLIVVLVIVPALAQTASAPVTYSMNLKPMLDAIVGLLAALLTGLGSWAVTRFSTYLKLQNDSQVRAVVTAGVNTAIGYAITKLQASTADLGSVKTQNALVAEATTFMAAHFADGLKYFGLSTDDLARMILARLPAPVDPAPVPAAAPAAA